MTTFTLSIGSRQLFSGELSALDAWIAAHRRITFFSICSGIEAATVAWKPLGNSWAVPKFRWLGERIARLMPYC